MGEGLADSGVGKAQEKRRHLVLEGGVQGALQHWITLHCVPVAPRTS